LTWHLGQVDVQADTAMGRYSSQTRQKEEKCLRRTNGTELSKATHSY